MPEEIEVFVGMVALPSAGIVGWRALVETVFTESDFVSRPRATAHRQLRQHADYYRDEPLDAYHYLRASAATVRKRLLIQGYTKEFCAQSWDIARRHTIDLYRRWETKPGGEIDVALSIMESISYEAWQEEIRRVVRSQPDKRVAGRQQPWTLLNLLDEPSDPLVQLAILTEISPRASVWMDCSELYEDGAPIRPPQELAREEQAVEALYPNGKIIVLTEGKSDTRIITAALRAFYPEYADLYQFIDFEEFRIEGGASLLAGMVKVLSGARIQNRLLALFDNDAAGLEAIESLKNVKFPRTVRLRSLPPTDLAASYPTLGPAGLTDMNVNGAGAPLELYLGRSSLIDSNGALRPVRWQEWKGRIQRYQGVVQDKEAVTTAFEAAIAGSHQPSRLRKRFPEMDLLLRSIFGAFEDNAPPMTP